MTEIETKLDIEILKEGTGLVPSTGDTVLMHYELWMARGSTSSDYDYDNKKYVDELYDSTYDERNPFSGPIEITIGKETPKDCTYSKGDSIRGIDEALLTMKVGGKRALVIPPELAYGKEGASSFHAFHGYRVPPNQPIKCNIELVAIKEESSESKENKSDNVAYEG